MMTPATPVDFLPNADADNAFPDFRLGTRRLALSAGAKIPNQHHSSPIGDVNPFSSRFIRAGAIPFLFSQNTDAESLVRQLADQGWWGQIIGPHGSGKSTLLHALAPSLRSAGRDVHRHALNSQSRAFPLVGEVAKRWTDSSQVIVDGYEQLGWRVRRKLIRTCRKQGCGLLVTSHRPVGLPTLFRTSVSRQRAHAVVEKLLPDTCEAITSQDITAAWQRHRGNLREALFELYDVFEQRRYGRCN